MVRSVARAPERGKRTAQALLTTASSCPSLRKPRAINSAACYWIRVRLHLPALALLALAAACGGTSPEPLPFQPASPTDHPSPAARGPFPVGVRTVVYTDPSRKMADGSLRKLTTEIWYPAVQSARGKAGAAYDILEYFTPAQQAQVGPGKIPLLQTDAVRDAAPARTHGPFPLVVFSHGHGAVRYQSTYYTVVLASHGYVVVSPDHEGDTLAEAVRSGLYPVTQGILDRPADVSFLIDQQDPRYAIPVAGDPLAGLVDLSRVGVTGHSFGGLTSLRVAALDSRVKAIVPQAPTGTDVAWIGLRPPTLPVLLQAAHEDRTLTWNENAGQAWPTLPHPRYLLDLTHGGHFTFSDLCGLDLASLASQIHFDIPGTDLNNVLNDGCGPNATPAAVAQPIIDATAIGFFNAYLRGDLLARQSLTQAAADALSPGAAQVTTDP